MNIFTIYFFLIYGKKYKVFIKRDKSSKLHSNEKYIMNKNMYK